MTPTPRAPAVRSSPSLSSSSSRPTLPATSPSGRLDPGPRAQVGTQAVGRARTAVPVEEMTRMFGLVGGDLMWTQDMAAFGQSEVTTYASGRLGRVDA